MRDDLVRLLTQRDGLDHEIRRQLDGAARAIAQGRGWTGPAHECLRSIALSSDGTELVLSWEFTDDSETIVEQERLRLHEVTTPDAVFLRFRRLHPHICDECSLRTPDLPECPSCGGRTSPAWFHGTDTPAQVKQIAGHLLASGQEAAFCRDFPDLTEGQATGLTLTMLEPLLAAEDRNVREAAQAALSRVQRPPGGPSGEQAPRRTRRP